MERKQLGVSFLDVSTGEFLTAQGSDEYIDKLLQNFQPSEVLLQKQHRQKFTDIFGTSFHSFYLDDWIFQDDFANDSLKEHFKVNSLKGYGIDDLQEGIISSGAILYYLSETQHNKLAHIAAIQRIQEDRYVWMDRFTIRNLELYASTEANAVTLLLIVIDQTISPMGARLLRRWLALPLKDIEQIKKRQDIVKYLIDTPDFYELVTYQIKQISDIERLVSKVATGKIHPREVIYLKKFLTGHSSNQRSR